MGQYHVSASDLIPAPPLRVYHILRDYHKEHPAILPKPYFEALRVIQGGMGEGTVFEADMNVMGTKGSFRMSVREPEPGRVLIEEDAAIGLTTTFVVDPVQNGDQAHLTISTDGQTSPGFKGMFERLFMPLILKRVYRAEFKKLAAYVQEE